MKTKLLLLLSWLMLISILTVYAQNKYTVYAGYGMATIPQINELLGGNGVSLNYGSYPEISTSNKSFNGALMAGFRTYAGPRVEFGGAVIYDKVTRDINSSADKVGQINESYTSIMADVRFNYLDRHRVRLYSEAGLGLCYHTQSATGDFLKRNTRSELAYQATILGISYGHKLLVFLNGGIGYKGFASAGIGYQW